MLTKSTLNCLLIAILPCLFTFSSCNNQTDELLNNTEFNNSKNSLLLRKKTISNYEEEYNYYGKKISLLVLEAIVQYEDKTKQGGTEYNTGILTFQIIQ